MVWDSVNPDILFASEWVYNKKSAFKKFRKLWNKAKVKVMYAAEAIEPDFNLFDYFIGFSNKCQMGDRFIRILSPLDMFSGFITTVENDICTLEKAADCLKQKHGFAISYIQIGMRILVVTSYFMLCLLIKSRFSWETFE